MKRRVLPALFSLEGMNVPESCWLSLRQGFSRKSLPNEVADEARAAEVCYGT